MSGGIYPHDPLAAPLSQEPRSLVVPPVAPGQPQSVGVAVADIPSRLVGADGIKVANSGLDWRVSMDIGPLQVAAGAPNQQWLPVWLEGTPLDAIRRVPVNAIPADAAHDNIVYGRQNGLWVPAISSVTIAWGDITGKPATFPPTLPIPTSGVTNLDIKQAEQDGRLSTNEGGIAANAAAITTNANAITTLTNDKVAKAGDAMSGPLTVVTPPVGAAHASSKQYVDTQVATKIGDAPNDGQQYARKNLAWTPFVIPTPAPAVGLVDVGDAPPVSPLDRQLFWESDTGGLFIRFNDGNSAQWVQVNPGGLQDAVSDSAAYGRLNGTWQKVLPLTGGALTGKMSVAVNIVDYAATFNNANATNGAGGVIGYVGANYGILGYVTGGTAYSLYGTGLIFVNGAIGSGGNISAAGTCQGAALAATGVGGVSSAGPYYSSAVSNFIMNYLNQANITTGTGQFELMFGGTARYRYQNTYECPVQDNAIYCGLSSNRWLTVYAVVGTINTSDEREKKDIRPLDEREKAAARRIKNLIVAYRWKERIAKDDRDKIYIGVIAQRIEAALNEEGLDANDYAMWSRDELTTHHDPVIAEDGSLISEARDEPNGEYRYSVDYNQVLAFIIGGL